jgi:hypothetical protein
VAPVRVGRVGAGLVVAIMIFVGCASPRPPAPFREAVVRLGIVPDPQVNVSVAIRQEPRCPQTVALLITEGR